MSDVDWLNTLADAGAVVERTDQGLIVRHFGRPDDEYAALTGGAGVVDLSARSRIEITGADRASFLHNLCTNEIRKLPNDGGCEAFFLNAKGHVFGFCQVFARAESHLLETSPGQSERLMSHLDRYIIREKVFLHDRTTEQAELLVAGAESAELLRRLTGEEPPAERLAGAMAKIEGCSVEIRRVEMTRPTGFLLILDRGHLPSIWTALVSDGGHLCGQHAFEAARIEAGFPCYGRDISERNLPQEVNRDERAISFVKGCYIGQETVARIDALGHVNRELVGVRFEGCEVPVAGTPLRIGGDSVGEVTSATLSGKLGHPLALAYLRRGHDQPGTSVESDFGRAEVVPLPV